MKSFNSIVLTPTPSLEKSLDFYQRLNYQVVSQENPCLVTDGKMVIEIDPDKFARAGVKLFQTDWSKEIAALKEIVAITEYKEGHLLSDPNGVRIYLIASDSPVKAEALDKSYASTGNFAGLSIEATDLSKTAAIWEALGFEKTQGAIEQGWLTFSNNSGLDVSLMRPMMCPHLFFNPSLTFFNGGNNLENIGKIKAAGIPITQDITHFNKEGIVDNIIIRDPGGYGFFVFND